MLNIPICKKRFYQWNQQSTIFTGGPCKYGENPRAWDWPCLHWSVAGESNLPGNHYVLYWRCWDRIESRDFTNVCYLAIHRQKEKAFQRNLCRKGYDEVFSFLLDCPRVYYRWECFSLGSSVWNKTCEDNKMKTSDRGTTVHFNRL